MKRCIDPAVARCKTVADLWTEIKRLHGADDGLYERRWEGAARGVKMMQFNMLAEGLSSVAGKAPPLKAELASDGGGFDSVPKDVLDFERRKWFLLEEVLRNDPDVLGLQECDHFETFFGPALALAGYHGSPMLKDPSPCSAYGYYPDGVALFFKSTMFMEAAGPSGAGCKPVHIFRTLVHKESGFEFTVLVTHLKAKCNEENEAVRERQVEALLQALPDPETHPVVVLADMNSSAFPEHGVSPKAVPAFLSKGFASAYPLDPDGYTTAKIRGPLTTSHTIDYILHTKHFTPTAWLIVPALSDLDPSVLLPCPRYPSDHFSISATLDFPRVQSQ
eukprot:TRINITY_DN20169_c0_g1_i1.p1 TRINITY_DN20169_c0_g1~~TRINITY_DN20169_c0_g1_i1.p1  ORF type:complete len:334 (+),score=47.90 TRINITY_DN20169_c0_g1_i1:59-1060(+)